jgi:hypothetical protein
MTRVLKLADQPRVVAGITIQRGTPPAAKLPRGVKRAEYLAAEALLPGDFFEWRKPPNDWRRYLKRWIRETSLPLVGYRPTAGGGVIIRRLTASEAASEGRSS